MDRRIRVRVRDAEILEVKEIVSDQVTYENVWLRHYESGVVQAYVYGAWREFRAGSQEQSLEGVLADLSLSGGSLTQIALKKDTIRESFRQWERTRWRWKGTAPFRWRIHSGFMKCMGSSGRAQRKV